MTDGGGGPFFFGYLAVLAATLLAAAVWESKKGQSMIVTILFRISDALKTGSVLLEDFGCAMRGWSNRLSSFAYKIATAHEHSSKGDRS